MKRKKILKLQYQYIPKQKEGMKFKMKSKIPKELKSLLIKRRNAGIKLLELDTEVEKMLGNLNLVDSQEYAKLQNDYGCMLTTEPINYYEMTIEYIEKQLNKEGYGEFGADCENCECLTCIKNDEAECQNCNKCNGNIGYNKWMMDCKNYEECQNPEENKKIILGDIIS